MREPLPRGLSPVYEDSVLYGVSPRKPPVTFAVRTQCLRRGHSVTMGDLLVCPLTWRPPSHGPDCMSKFISLLEQHLFSLTVTCPRGYVHSSDECEKRNIRV